jgi:Predicted metal-binding integral membrane protein (DUF2182)
MASEDADQIAARIAQRLRDAGFGCKILDSAPTETAFGTLLQRDRIIVALALTLLTAVMWSYLLLLSVDMGTGGMDMTGFRIIPSGMGLMMPAHTPWRAMEFAFVFAMWTVMMVGMMTSSAMPMILMYARVGRYAEPQSTPLAATVWFVAGYFLVWVAFAVLATLVQWALERRFAQFPDGKHEQHPRRARVRGGGQLPVDPPQGRMSYPMPDAVCVPDASWWLSPRRAGLPCARATPWRVLRRLLLGTNGPVVRGRRNEPVLGRRTLVTHFLGAGPFLGPPGRSPCRHSPHRGRCMVVVNGNVLTHGPPQRTRRWPSGRD